MNLRIAVCDDEAAERGLLCDIVSEWANRGGIGAEITQYQSAEAFLFDCGERCDFDILLLDIEMKGINGVELAKRIRAGGFDARIVFVTGYGDYIAEGYEVSALHYLLKPVSKAKLLEVLDRAAASCAESSRYILLPLGRESVRVCADDVLYAESQAHYMIVHTKGGEYRLRMTLPELAERLGEGFYRCSRSYIVGLKQICRVTKSDVCLEGGARVPLGKGMYDDINLALIKYLRGV